MAKDTGNGRGRHWSRWRGVGWTVPALILLLPLVAMPFTDEVHWEGADFALAGALLVAVGIPYELAVRRTGDAAYRAAVGVALVAAFLLVWVNGAVGLIGSEDNDANLMYGGVVAVGVIGTGIARFRPRGMARALFATALAHVSVVVIALIAELGEPVSGPFEIVTSNAFFVALFVGSALLFRKAVRERPTGRVAPDDRPCSSSGASR